ncbi:MAG: hypothetical protein ACK54X_11695 [Burkholderiales bacterium]
MKNNQRFSRPVRPTADRHPTSTALQAAAKPLRRRLSRPRAQDSQNPRPFVQSTLEASVGNIAGMTPDVRFVWGLTRTWPWRRRARMRLALLLDLAGFRKLAVRVARLPPVC